MHKANPRYMDDGTGKAVLLVGSHTWGNLQDDGVSDPPSPFDFSAYLKMLSEHNHNFMRLWRLEPAEYRYAEDGDAGETRHTQPHPWPRTGPGAALDGKPRFDLSRFDDAYFSRLRMRVEQAQDAGIYVAIMLFEGHALSHAADAWNAHPFNAANNINGINGDVDGDGRGIETQTLAIDAVLRVQEAYVARIIEAVNDLDNVLFEVCNEAHPDSLDWQRHMIRLVRDAESRMPKRHLVIHSISLGAENSTLWDSPAPVVAPGKQWINDRILLREDPPPADGSRIVILDTDHLWGCGGDASWVFKAFLRGYHPIYMDPWQAGGACGKPDQQMRRNLGYALRFADRMNLAAATPQGHLASTGYCLANPGHEYLVYLPERGQTSLNLGDAERGSVFSVEWFSPGRGESRSGDSIGGGQSHVLTSPFAGDALLYVRSSE